MGVSAMKQGDHRAALLCNNSAIVPRAGVNASLQRHDLVSAQVAVALNTPVCVAHLDVTQAVKVILADGDRLLCKRVHETARHNTRYVQVRHVDIDALGLSVLDGDVDGHIKLPFQTLAPAMWCEAES